MIKVTLSQLRTVTGALYRIDRSLIRFRSSGKDALNRGSLSLRWNVANDGAALKSNGRVFQACMARRCSSEVQWEGVPGLRGCHRERAVAECRMACCGTTNVIELAERRRRRVDHPHRLPAGATLRGMTAWCCAGSARHSSYNTMT